MFGETFFYCSFCYFRNDCKIRNVSVIRVSLLTDEFLNRGATKEDFSRVGKDPVESERLTMERIVRAIVDEMFLRSDVGIGSRSQ